MEKQNLPNSTLILVLGILSIIGCCFYSIPGIIAGTIAIILGVKSTRLYKSDPEKYINYGNVNAGKIMGIIGLSLSIIYLILILIAVATFGWATLNDADAMREILEEMQNQ